MTKELPRLKLGKGAAFVKTHLKQLPQGDDTWDADFRALPRPVGQTETHYLGLVVGLPKGIPLVYLPVEYTPNANDLADLLADALRRPLTDSPHRPRRIYFRDNPRWEELFPHLKELGIEISIQTDLPHLEIVYEDFLRQMRKGGSGLRLVYFPGPPPVDEQFPAIAQWVQKKGWIEVGQKKDSGFVVRALNEGGVRFEDDQATTLPEAMTALEEGLLKGDKGRSVRRRSRANPGSHAERITIIPHIHGKITRDGKKSEPDTHWIIEKWLERHPEVKGRERDIRITGGYINLPQGMKTEMVSVSIVSGPDIAGYDPAEDADLYEYYLAEERDG